MASSISMTKRRLKPLFLKDYLLDDLSSCSSNGFKSFPRRQSSSTIPLLLKANIKRSRTFHYKGHLTCGLAFTHALQKASTALLNAVKLLPFPSSVKPPSRKRDYKKLFSKSFWKKPLRCELNGEIGQQVENHEHNKIQRWKSFGDFLQESQDHQPSSEATLSNMAGELPSFSSNLEETQSSGGESNAVKTTETLNRVGVMKSGDCVGSSVINNREECVNEEKEQLSPISILECPFEDDSITPRSYQKETDEKKLMSKHIKLERLVRLEPVNLEKRIKEHVERQDCKFHMEETEERQNENRANRLFALVKSKLIEEPNQLLASHKVDNVVIDFFKENENSDARDEDKLVKIVEEWVLRGQEQDCMFMSWDVREKREIYVQEMKWGYINGDEKEYVVEELGNIFVTSLIDEFILDFSFWN